MIYKRREGQESQIGFNYTWKENDTLFALRIVIPIFLIPSHFYDEEISCKQVYGKRFVVCTFGFRYRKYVKDAWESFNQRFYFYYPGFWLMPVGKQRG